MKESKIIHTLAGFFAKMIPKINASGLWITDGLVSYYNPNNNRNEQVSLRLPPGIVGGGRVQNQESLTKILLELRKRISPKSRKDQSVILTIPITNVYIQPFTLPAIAFENIHESARLNMRMISPIELDKAYYSWQQISGDGSDQIEMLGAFIVRDVVDGFIACVQDAGYSVAAVEFNTLSLSRAALKSGVIDNKTPALLLEIAPGGLNFSISHLGHLFFHHFVSWTLFGEGEKSISTERFRIGFVDEVRRMTNFYSTNRKGQEVKKMVLISPTFTEEIGKLITEYFPGIEVEVVDPKQVNPVVGAALRGLLSHSSDNEISLTTLSAIEVFGKYQLANFLSIWRNIFLTIFGSVLFVFLSSALILQRVAAQASAQDPFSSNTIQDAELLRLESEAQKFNTLVSTASDLVLNKKKLSKVARRLNGMTGASVWLIRINIEASRSLVSIEGLAKNREAITQFNNALEDQPQFAKVNLALPSVKTQPDGTETFSLSFEVESFDF